MQPHKMLQYPNVECAAHPGIVEPGYLICDHIEKAEDIAYLEEATSSDIGTIACMKCAEKLNDDDYVGNHFNLGCSSGIKEMHLIDDFKKLPVN